MYEEVGEVFVCFTMKYYEEGGPVLRQFPLAVARRRKKPFLMLLLPEGFQSRRCFLAPTNFLTCCQWLTRKGSINQSFHARLPMGQSGHAKDEDPQGLPLPFLTAPEQAATSPHSDGRIMGRFVR